MGQNIKVILYFRKYYFLFQMDWKKYCLIIPRNLLIQFEFSQFSTYSGKIWQQKGNGFKWLFNIFSNVLRLWPSYSSSKKNCVASLVKYWKLPRKIGCMEGKCVEYLRQYSTDFLRTFITSWKDNWLSNKNYWDDLNVQTILLISFGRF